MICRLQQELDLKRHALSLLQDRIAGSESAQLAGAVAELEAQLQEATAAAEAARGKKAEMVAAAKVRLLCNILAWHESCLSSLE